MLALLWKDGPVIEGFLFLGWNVSIDSVLSMNYFFIIIVIVLIRLHKFCLKEGRWVE